MTQREFLLKNCFIHKRLTESQRLSHHKITEESDEEQGQEIMKHPFSIFKYFLKDRGGSWRSSERKQLLWSDTAPCHQ